MDKIVVLIKEQFGAVVALARVRAGLTREELAEKMGWTVSRIQGIESGSANPTVGEIGAVLGTMGCQLSLAVSDIHHQEDSDATE